MSRAASLQAERETRPGTIRNLRSSPMPVPSPEGAPGCAGAAARPAEAAAGTAGRRPAKALLLLVLALLLAVPGSLRAAGWTGWEAFREASSRLQSLDAQFVQRKTLPVLAKPFVSTGRLCYQPPGSLRWEYEQPVRSVLVMQGGQVRRYLRDKDAWREDATGALPAMQTVLNEIASWQRGRFDADPHFEASLVEGPEPRVLLVPRDAAWRKMIRQVELTPSREQAGVIRSVRISEDDRSFTVLEFSQVRLNRTLPAALFERPE